MWWLLKRLRQIFCVYLASSSNWCATICTHYTHRRDYWLFFFQSLPLPGNLWSWDSGKLNGDATDKKWRDENYDERFCLAYRLICTFSCIVCGKKKLSGGSMLDFHHFGLHLFFRLFFRNAIIALHLRGKPSFSSFFFLSLCLDFHYLYSFISWGIKITLSFFWSTLFDLRPCQNLISCVRSVWVCVCGYEFVCENIE